MENLIKECTSSKKLKEINNLKSLSKGNIVMELMERVPKLGNLYLGWLGSKLILIGFKLTTKRCSYQLNLKANLMASLTILNGFIYGLELEKLLWLIQMRIKVFRLMWYSLPMALILLVSWTQNKKQRNFSMNFSQIWRRRFQMWVCNLLKTKLVMLEQ